MRIIKTIHRDDPAFSDLKNFSVIAEDVDSGMISYIDLDETQKSDNAELIAKMQAEEAIQDAVIPE